MIATAFKRLVEACRRVIVRFGFEPHYHRFLRDGGVWRTPFLAQLKLRDGDRILEVHRRGSSVTADLSQLKKKIQFTLIEIDPMPSSPQKESIEFKDDRLTCNGGQFDNVICTMVLHPLSPERKIALLGELRRVLRNGGKLYVADFDAPIEPREGTMLRGLSYKFGYQSTAPHIDGTWTTAIEKAGFDQIKRLESVAEWLSRVIIIRARR